MSATYLILPEKKLIIGRFSGLVGADDIKRLLLEIWADPRFDRAFHMLMDFSKAALRIGMAEVTMLCHSIMTVAEGVMGSAAIIASGPVGTALAMLLSKGLSLFTPSAVFSTWDAALNFLGVDLPEEAR